ncbi:helix-turn-helix domain-containing protein [Streptobacillus ratti]|uniref:helix-turn-helix domain-containing protein n=1 Tax=Streptobacillus ratti TaxID=1720557 RepID=UPI0009343C40|nr:helix-turn-helix domain-containing protein [Streptobacillus ratti]
MKINERLEIEIRLKDGLSIRNIANKLNKSPSTILREIEKYKHLVKNPKVITLKTKSENDIIVNHPCSILKKTPYVCNSCFRYINKTCSYHFMVYDGYKAQLKYEKLKSISNIKKNNSDLIREINRLLSLGQTKSHIYLSMKEKYNDEMFSQTTMYNLINRGILIDINKKKRLI